MVCRSTSVVGCCLAVVLVYVLACASLYVCGFCVVEIRVEINVMMVIRSL